MRDEETREEKTEERREDGRAERMEVKTPVDGDWLPNWDEALDESMG